MADKSTALKGEVQELLLVGLGAVPGALLRWQMTLNLVDNNLAANTLGSALLGFLAGLPYAPRRQLLVGIGFCGSVTTFSSWMLDAIRLLGDGDIKSAAGLIGLTLGLGIGAAALGLQLGRKIRLPGPTRSGLSDLRE